MLATFTVTYIQKWAGGMVERLSQLAGGLIFFKQRLMDIIMYRQVIAYAVELYVGVPISKIVIAFTDYFHF